jgi:copper chaperone
METLQIKGMSCQHCVGSVQKTLEAIAGLSEVSVNLDAGEATFESDGANIEEIKAAITGIGFEPID